MSYQRNTARLAELGYGKLWVGRRFEVCVETAILAATDQKHIIVTCALAAAPDAWSSIIAVGQKYQISTNPLDFPGVPGQQLSVLSPTKTTYYVTPQGVTTVDPKKTK